MMESKQEKSINSEMLESTASITDSVSKMDSKESIEERYNKLRGFAVKLKKKVNDLSDQLKKSETEKMKIHADKEELQNKILEMSDNTKRLQAIQAGYDKLQDETEQLKNANKKLTKNLEHVINENATLKESLSDAKDKISQLTSETENLATEKTKLETVLKQSQDEAKKLKEERKAEGVIKAQRNKEYEEMKNKLKAVKSQLEVIKQTNASNNVLSLEVENYEKSIEEMKSKLTEELAKKVSLEKAIEEHLGTINALTDQITELRNSSVIKTNQVTLLSERNESIKEELCQARAETEKAKDESKGLLERLQNIEKEKNDLTAAVKTVEKQLEQNAMEFKEQKEGYIRKMKELESEISVLNATITNGNDELEALRSEYSGYKLRAQSVLRTKQSQSKEVVVGGRSLAELEEELNHSNLHASLLRDKLDSSQLRVESLTTEITLAKEERQRAVESHRECSEKLLALRQDFTALMERFRSQTMQIQQMQSRHNEELENREKCHISEISLLEEKHRKELEDLKLELIHNVTKDETFVDNRTSHEKDADQHPESANQARMNILEREEGEGSESLDTCVAGTGNNEKYRQHSLMPLDELLSSQDNTNTVDVSYSAGGNNCRQMETYERSIKHLTMLLADAERDIAKLTQLNELLKEDIRRQQRSVEREQHANNFEYLKNVVFKFVTLRNGDERNRLIPVLTTILKLSPEETQKLNAIAGVNGKSWIPGIPIPGWTNI